MLARALADRDRIEREVGAGGKPSRVAGKTRVSAEVAHATTMHCVSDVRCAVALGDGQMKAAVDVAGK